MPGKKAKRVKVPSTYWCVTVNGELFPLNIGATREEAKWTVIGPSMMPWKDLKKEGYGLKKVKVVPV